ncbi:hypothetical protein CTH_0858 [Carboxydocella thermautotrophica]|nr:hypothetical protein CTH_0858 [Carboxydocella thermautotrophica]
MSELIDNGKEKRQQLKEIILALHAGKDPEVLKREFKHLLEKVGASEVGALEQELIASGELSEQEVKRLCDVHAALFQEGLEKQGRPEEEPGHPVHTFKLENRAIEQVVAEERKIIDRLATAEPEELKELLAEWRQVHSSLMEIEKHYSRKENIVFPYLEQHGISGPSKVMWAVHDDIRALLKQVRQFLASPPAEREEIVAFARKVALPALEAVTSMIFKEENILFPMCLDKFTPAQWQAIYDQSDEIGYTLIEPAQKWRAAGLDVAATQAEGQVAATGKLKVGVGELTLEEITLIFNHLPVDITFVDRDDVVRYFSQGPERIFARTPAIIGRRVQNCHPPDSVHIVEKILDDFKHGRRNKAEFWLPFNGMYVYITYFAVRNEKGEYAGTLEVTQNIKPLQAISGEKRILDEN